MTPVVGSALAPPIAVPGTDGRVHLAYELQLTNTLAQEVTLTSVAAVAGDKTLLTLSGDGLAYWTRVLGSTTPTVKLGPAQTAVVWLDVAVDEAASVPTDITHTIGMTVPPPQPPLVPAALTENIAPTKVDTRRPVTISSPVSGPSWLDGNSCCDMTSHRMAVIPLNGQLWAPERFAVDYVQLTPEGRLFNGPKTELSSYPYFGANIHAVADGPVVVVVDSLPEQVPGSLPTGLPLDQYSGNYVVQDIGGGQLRLLRPPQARQHQGQGRRSTQDRAGHRRVGKFRQHRRPASALPSDEHPGFVALQRVTVHFRQVPARLAGRIHRCVQPAPGHGRSRADAAGLRRGRQDQQDAAVPRRDDLSDRIGRPTGRPPPCLRASGPRDTDGPDGIESVTGVQTVAAGTSITNLDPFAEAISKAETVGASDLTFVVHPDTLLTLSKLKSGTGFNTPLLGVDATSPTKRSILGVPITWSPAVTATDIWAVPRSEISSRPVDRSQRWTHMPKCVRRTAATASGGPLTSTCAAVWRPKTYSRSSPGAPLSPAVGSPGRTVRRCGSRMWAGSWPGCGCRRGRAPAM